MAFMDFAVAAATGTQPVAASKAFHLFDRAEWSVIGLAAHDDTTSLAPDGWWARLRHRLFGIEAPRPLANERLEALRRFAVTARLRRRKIDHHEIARFVAAGFSAFQADMLLAIIDDARPSSAMGSLA
ncbi:MULTISPECIES: hypothetical protein [Sphingomonadales]|uniref:Uncharacterized protein n=2 Tax=Edaphosphingomonas TaxID=3423724 RepID=A0A1S1HCB9_9SPHN|nr:MULTISPECIES: hypothetical protein [Sphingomonas]AGH51244.1 hypothetical protein G432_17630 [Sphingomonas sp. MM-1]MDX3884694.1 hypothetical protein [Sphingomonas sp.]OHT19777.1 hypothetical protein BHE75_01766 [Sphingomonas haloaromaticamans]